ncbi:hypothetical protein EVAR_28519_1 [Eumeta japonica]|uniref:Uncharacterized protein n=1 Tax=Eumeta variegata TaxID=151549 RepID=A0A4C1WNW1_EUMVA|nr:hypothetical protein EVAR_28519_1 [Eumeta japonica]
MNTAYMNAHAKAYRDCTRTGSPCAHGARAAGTGLSNVQADAPSMNCSGISASVAVVLRPPLVKLVLQINKSEHRNAVHQFAHTPQESVLRGDCEGKTEVRAYVAMLKSPLLELQGLHMRTGIIKDKRVRVDCVVLNRLRMRCVCLEFSTHFSSHTKGAPGYFGLVLYGSMYLTCERHSLAPGAATGRPHGWPHECSGLHAVTLRPSRLPTLATLILCYLEGSYTIYLFTLNSGIGAWAQVRAVHNKYDGRLFLPLQAIVSANIANVFASVTGVEAAAAARAVGVPRYGRATSQSERRSRRLHRLRRLITYTPALSGSFFVQLSPSAAARARRRRRLDAFFVLFLRFGVSSLCGRAHAPLFVLTCYSRRRNGRLV